MLFRSYLGVGPHENPSEVSKRLKEDMEEHEWTFLHEVPQKTEKVTVESLGVSANVLFVGAVFRAQKKADLMTVPDWDEQFPAARKVFLALNELEDEL